jgi:hypothetical protein
MNIKDNIKMYFREIGSKDVNRFRWQIFVITCRFCNEAELLDHYQIIMAEPHLIVSSVLITTVCKAMLYYLIKYE